MAKFNPKIWTLGLRIGIRYIQRGTNDFVTWKKKMTEDVGKESEPWLSAIWETLCNIPEGSKFNDKQLWALADRIGGLYSHGTTNLYEIAKAIEGDIGAENTAKLFPMIQATYRGIKRYFDDLKRKAPPAVKTKTIASGVCGENLTWTLDDDGTLIISGTGEMENYSSKQEAPWINHRKFIKKIIIKHEVTAIGDSAFNRCTSLKNVKIPNSVITIGHIAFGFCENLTSIKIPDSVKIIGDCTFILCMKLIDVKIPNSVTSIGVHAFSACEYLTKIKIPDSVTTIGAYAFGNCSSLKSIKIPDSVMIIGEKVFSDCESLQKIYYPAERGFEKNLSEGNNAKLIPYEVAPPTIEAGTRGTCGENLTWTLDDDGTLTISGTGEMETYWDYQKKPWYAQRELIQKIILKDGVTTIGYTAFEDCVNLQEITIPDSVKMIDGAAFSHCGKLKSITIPEGVKTIYPFTFSLCYSLIEVNFPDSIKHISYSAFSYCESLIIIRIPSSVTEVGENIFKDCTSLEKIYYPVGRNFEENLSQGNNAKLIPYDVASSAIEAGTRGICGKNLIWTLDDDGTLTISGTGEMKSYPQVQNLPWFNYRERIKNVVIDFGVTSISERVFWNCKSLTKITISDSVVSIGERTFWSCNSLIEINIPISVVSIGGAPFKGCVYLKKIYYPAGRDFEKILSAGNTAELVPY